MNLHLKNWISNWIYAAASVALVSIVFVATAPRNSAAIADPVAVTAPIEEAAAGITFRIVPAEALSKNLSWAPLTGDGSN